MPRKTEIEFEEHGIRGYYTCSKCKAPIAGEHFDEHRVFHAEIEELIGWAQAVSKNIGVAHTLKEAEINAQEG